MLEYLPVLRHTALFAGVQGEEVAAMLTCLGRFPKGSTVLKEGDYEGIGHCILGYADGEEPQPKPRKTSYVYWAK